MAWKVFSQSVVCVWDLCVFASLPCAASWESSPVPAIFLHPHLSLPMALLTEKNHVSLFLIPCAVEFHILCLWRDCKCSITYCPCPVSPASPAQMTVHAAQRSPIIKKNPFLGPVFWHYLLLFSVPSSLDTFLYLLFACCLLPVRLQVSAFGILPHYFTEGHQSLLLH